MKAAFKNITLQFKFPAGTSRGVLNEKKSSLILLEEDGVVGIGECSTIPGLSPDPTKGYQDKLIELCNVINHKLESIDLSDFPSIVFGLESAILDLKVKGSKKLFNTPFSKGKAGIPINGLVWMGDKTFMKNQIKEKIKAGFSCIKLKIGALDFQTELEILADIRKDFPKEKIQLRLDANGAFSPDEALMKLQQLSVYDIHSIEQPVKNCGDFRLKHGKSPIPIALDEELIGISSKHKEEFLLYTKPQFIVLKPSLLGGLKSCEEWVGLAEKLGVGWWVTSALESNIGLNAIAQWVATLGVNMPQGLGTGQLYRNNIPSPLEISKGKLYYRQHKDWDLG
jgi:o-succinylbenzoate synthase